MRSAELGRGKRRRVRLKGGIRIGEPKENLGQVANAEGGIKMSQQDSKKPRSEFPIPQWFEIG